MSVQSLIEEIQNHPTPDRIDLGPIMERLREEFDREQNSDQRGLLLSLYTLLNDAQERILSPEDLETFRQSRKQMYRLFLVKESTVNDQISLHLLRLATDREVDAGRMSEDDELRKLAVAGDDVLTPKPREKLTAWGFIKALVS